MAGKLRGVVKKKRNEPPILQLRITGPGVRRGRISVPDLIRLCGEAQNAVNKQAEVLKDRKTIHPGPIAQVIKQECTLELVGIKANCTTLQFALSKPQMDFNFPEEVGDFGRQVISEVGTKIRSLGNGNKELIDPGVLVSIYELGSVVQPKGISKIEWITPKNGHGRKLTAPVTKAVRERAASCLSSPRKIIAHVDGILDMADFKPGDKKVCRIDPPVGVSITCTFDAEKENEIYKMMRQPVRATGEASLQPYTDRIEKFHIQSINLLHSLDLGADNFFAESSIEELAKAQRIKPLRDAHALAGGIPADQDVDEFVEDIYGARQ
ncbi:MAG TPA: hypothetical protein VI636_13705 [Candidatus Angelobacter sp.]